MLEQFSEDFVKKAKDLIVSLLSEEHETKFLVAIDKANVQPHFFTYKTLAKNIKVSEKDQMANLIINNARG